MRGKVSVIIPCYNQAEFLPEAIQSLLSQTYTNWEAIVVDDGSTEDVLSVVHSFNDNRVKFIRQENTGLPSARNTGLSLASGDYIQFLDADDMLHPHKFESQLEGLYLNNADISISGYWAFKHPNMNDGVSTDTELKMDTPREDFIERWEKGLCIPIHCFLYRKYVVDEAGWFNTTLPNHEDWDFHIRIAYKNYLYCHDAEKYALYRVHDKSMCRATNMDNGRQMVLDIHKDWRSVQDYNRINLTDVTFIYCVRIDSPERLANLDFAMSFMWRNFYTNIVIAESDSPSMIRDRYRNVTHLIVGGHDSPFHRTKIINDVVKSISTPYFCNIDVDVFTDPAKYIEAIRALATFHVVYPYNGRFYDMPQKYNKNRRLKTSDIDIKDCGLINPNSFGGMVFFRRDIFLDGGMENEHFVSWGPEDNERYMRFKKLGYLIHRLPYALYHFTHPRGQDSNESNPYYQQCHDEYENILMMSKGELSNYISTFPWLKYQ